MLWQFSREALAKRIYGGSSVSLVNLIQVDCHPAFCLLVQKENSSPLASWLQQTSICLLEGNICNQNKMCPVGRGDTWLARNEVMDVSQDVFQFGQSNPRDRAHLHFMDLRQFWMTNNSLEKPGCEFKQLLCVQDSDRVNLASWEEWYHCSWRGLKKHA